MAVALIPVPAPLVPVPVAAGVDALPVALAAQRVPLQQLELGVGLRRALGQFERAS